MLKKAISKLSVLLLALVMVFTSIVPVLAEEQPAEQVAEQVIDPQLETAKQLLYDLDIVDEEADTDMSAQMTRAEFAVLACHFTGMFDTIVSEDAVKLNDVFSDYLEAPYIYTAVAAGYMAPVADGYFYPAWAITAEDAAKALLMSMGYGELALKNDTYARFAGTLDLYDGVDNDGKLTRGEAYKMIYNALHGKVMDQTSFGEVSKFVQLDEINALYKFHKVVKTTGTVTGADGVVLGSGSKADLTEGCIEINGTKFYLYDYDTTKILGRHVDAYWYNDTSASTKEIISINVLDEDDVMVLSADIIEDYKEMTYYYEDGKDTDTITLEDPYVVYNGEEYTGLYKKEIMKPESGEVTIISNYEGGDAEVVIIRSFKDVVVKAVLSDDMIVLGQDATERYDFLKYGNNIRYYKSNGTAAKFDDITTNTVISVAESGAGTKMDVYVSNDTVSGEITQKDTETNEWTIGEKAYKLSKYLQVLIDADKIDEAKFNYTYTFYLNYNGELAFYGDETASSEGGHFYAIVTGVEPGKGLSTDVSVKFFARSLGEFNTYYCAEKVELNGKKEDRTKVYEAFLRNGRTGEKGTKFVAQPVKLGVNENNEITYIMQAGNYDDGKDFFFFMGGVDKKATSGGYAAYRNVLYMTGEADGNAFHNYDPQKSKAIGVNTNTEFVQAPYFADGTMNTAQEKMFIGAKRPSGNFRYIAFKEKSDDLVAAFVILIADAEPKPHVENEFEIQMVLSIKRAMYEEEEVTVLQTNKMKYYINDPKIDLNKLKIYDAQGVDTGRTYKVVPGDLVNIAADALGYIQAIEIAYDSTNRKLMGSGTVGSGTSVNVNNDYRYISRGQANRLYLVNLIKAKDGYIYGVMGDPANPNPETDYTFTCVNPSLTCLVERNGKYSVRNAVATDLIGYEDSATDYATLVLSARWASCQTGFLYKHK